MNTLNDTKKGMAQAIEHFQEELKNIRTGRANPAMLDGVIIDVYGTQMRLKDLATVSVPEPRQLLITPFDRNNAGSISKAIEKADLGLQPRIDGHVVRITIPTMDEARRKEMAKRCHDEKEKCKVSIRNTRRDANDIIKKQKSSGELAEDDMKRLEKDIQKLTDKYCVQADELATEKEKEVMVI